MAAWALPGMPFQTMPGGNSISDVLIYRYTIYWVYWCAGMKKLTLSDYQDLAAFRYQIRKFLHFSEKAVQEAGLERGQYQLMLAIKGMPAGVRPRISDLAEQMQVRHNSAVELVNRLQREGCVRRERAASDRREVLLVLTPKGERVLAELALHHREELRTAAPQLVAALLPLMRGQNTIAKERVSLEVRQSEGPRIAVSE